MHDARRRRLFDRWRGSQRVDEQSSEPQAPDPDRHDQTSADAAGIIWNADLQALFEIDRWADREKLERLYVDRSKLPHQ